MCETYEMPEKTEYDMVKKIRSYAWDIRGDWSDPRGFLKQIDCVKN